MPYAQKQRNLKWKWSRFFDIKIGIKVSVEGQDDLTWINDVEENLSYAESLLHQIQ